MPFCLLQLVAVLRDVNYLLRLDQLDLPSLALALYKKKDMFAKVTLFILI